MNGKEQWQVDLSGRCKDSEVLEENREFHECDSDRIGDSDDINPLSTAVSFEVGCLLCEELTYIEYSEE